MAEDSKSGPSAASSHSGAVFSSLKILSYNVWFREDLEMHSRMKAIGDLIQLHSPDFICFQVTGTIPAYHLSMNLNYCITSYL